jgi:hypothetical protein
MIRKSKQHFNLAAFYEKGLNALDAKTRRLLFEALCEKREEKRLVAKNRLMNLYSVD